MRTYEHLDTFLRALMEERGVSAAQLSRLTEIDVSIIRDYLTARRKTVSTRNLLALAHFAELPLAEFIDRIA